jgi:hypothetical protein
MYKLFIQYGDGSQLNKTFQEKELREVLTKGVKGYIKWATVTTPSGCEKDVTRTLRK